MGTRRTTIVSACLVAIVALGLSACSSDDGGSAVTTFEVEADSFAFDPGEVTVVADEDITVTVENVSDSVEHEWVIVKPGNEIDEEDVLFEVEAVAPGGSGTGTFNVPAGEYQIICALEGHFTAGMEGSMTAEAASEG
jgi:plastocyanin